MELIISASYESSSKRAAADLVKFLSLSDAPLVCTASGDSPAGLYREIVNLVQNKELDISSWYFVGLDEWAGMNGDDRGSCRYHLDQQFFHPLQIASDHLQFFDGKNQDLDSECRDTETYISQHGGIDVAIIGLGMNGHIGMNEPGSSVHLRSHYAELDPLTKQVGQKYFTESKELEGGITLGLANLLEAKKIMLMVNGAHKAQIVQQVLTSTPSADLPATLLLRHPGLFIYLDEEAASLIKNKHA